MIHSLRLHTMILFPHRPKQTLQMTLRFSSWLHEISDEKLIKIKTIPHPQKKTVTLRVGLKPI